MENNWLKFVFAGAAKGEKNKVASAGINYCFISVVDPHWFQCGSGSMDSGIR